MRTVCDWRTAVMCLRIEPINAPIVRLTAHPVDLLMQNGAVYKTLLGYDFSSWEAVSDMAPGAVDLEGILDVVGISRDDLAAGVYDNARCYAFKTSWKAPIEDEQPEICSLLGRVTLIDNRFVAEEMALVDALNQSIGETYNVRCQKKFGTVDGPLIKRCNKALGPLTVTGTLTSVTSRLICRDSSRAEVADYFAYGTIQFTSGANAGLKPIQVKRSEADGTLELFEAAPYVMAAGDSYILIPGCRGRLEDCRDKWNNVINFGGFNRIPTNSQAGQWGTN